MHFHFKSPLFPVCGQIWILVLRIAYGLTFQTLWNTLSHFVHTFSTVMLCITPALQLMCFYFWLWKILKDLFPVYCHAIKWIFSVMHSLMSLSLNNRIFFMWLYTECFWGDFLLLLFILVCPLWSSSACTAVSLSGALVAYLKDSQLKLTTYSCWIQITHCSTRTKTEAFIK